MLRLIVMLGKVSKKMNIYVKETIAAIGIPFLMLGVVMIPQSADAAQLNKSSNSTQTHNQSINKSTIYTSPAKRADKRQNHRQIDRHIDRRIDRRYVPLARSHWYRHNHHRNHYLGLGFVLGVIVANVNSYASNSIDSFIHNGQTIFIVQGKTCVIVNNQFVQVNL